MHTIVLAPEVEARLEAEAARRELPVEDYLRTLVEEALPAPPSDAEFKARFATGADVVAYWQREGLLGVWADREDMQDSTEYVSSLRRMIEQQALTKQTVPPAREE